MKKTRIACALAWMMASAAGAHAQVSDDVIRIGFISDMSGIYRDYDGPAGADAIRMAIADMGGAIDGKRIELLTMDHQNKPDIAAAKAREWFDVNRLDMLIGGVNSGAAIAMAGVAADKKKPYFVVGSGASSLTNEFCSPYTIQYAYDTVAMARGTANAVVKGGGQSWFFVAADYAFGASLQSDATKVILANGGTVAGSVKHPLGASDFSSFMLQAQSSKAQVLALANAGGDTVNALKSAAEFGIGRNMKLAGMIITINDVHALGLKTAQNMFLTDSWYWNQSAESREWARRFFDKQKRMPSSFQAGNYSATLQYLKTVKAAGTDDGDKVMAQLRKAKFDDMFVKGGWLRGDGLMVHDMHLLQVKTPAESKEPWDYYKVVESIKGEVPWTTKAESRCARWKAG
ncbi:MULTISPECIES: ABC transporter substrate-binding protein [unclassified Variovorax]|uniref:ABC transporter substrate-binding protein n=1 Tax=unclassified Variovorax TaxID=663243 RepID=UPI00257557A1|nr:MULTISPECIES: ABC transporter substrate-binding protein [unclassified Variovorax]MDM0087478.1 ABC transporter substrate-binding protein [Variovorax sp. J22G40]MDM0144265.1 ABC transporter substrate-binding protein [Variovorax sp. J2P1-31]